MTLPWLATASSQVGHGIHWLIGICEEWDHFGGQIIAGGLMQHIAILLPRAGGGKELTAIRAGGDLYRAA